MPTPIAELADFDLDAVKSAVGPTSFKRGRSYANGKRVLSLVWDAGEEALSGSVVGNGAIYRTTAYFEDGAADFVEGECTCPVGYDCKHVAALVIAAVDRRRPAREVAAAGPRLVAAAATPTWEASLRALLPSASAAAVGNPMAIELSLERRSMAGLGG